MEQKFVDFTKLEGISLPWSGISPEESVKEQLNWTISSRGLFTVSRDQ
jgi:hypothetical protein